LSIEEPSEHRQPSSCPFFKKCGGCDWLHIAYPEQIRQKKLITRETFKRIGNIDLDTIEMVSGKPLGYRNRVQFQCFFGKEFGFMEKNTNKIIPISQCPILYPSLNKVLNNLKTDFNPCLISSPAITFPDKIKAFGFSDWSIIDCFNPHSAVSVEILQKRLYFDMNCFFQSNLELLPSLISFALDNFSGRCAMDLYCGIGLFSSFLSNKFEKVIALDNNPHSLKWAKQNAPGLNNSFILSSFEKYTPPAGQRIDLIIVDPPRQGLSKTARNHIIQLKAKNLVYVSCNPPTQARDLKILTENGYCVTEHCFFDFYPQTAYLESVFKLKQAT
jgi:23S rRNA (uracil1939-C5)-methyltransferase